MHYKTLRLASIALTGLLACATGCQITDLGSHSPARPATDDAVERLSDRQIAEVKLSLARTLERKRDGEPSIQAYREALEKDPQRALAYWRLAVLNDRQGNVQESEKLYRQALKLEPKNAEIHCDFGYSLYLQRRWAEAEESLRQAVALKSAMPRAHNNLGLVLAQTGRVDESLAEFRKSGCKEAEARANLAFVLTLNRCWDEARAQYELALDANPDSAAAKVGLESLEAVVAKASSGAESVALASNELNAGMAHAAASAAATSASARAAHRNE